MKHRIFYLTDIDLNEKTARPIHVLEVIKNFNKLGNETKLFIPSIGKNKKIKHLKIVPSFSMNIPLINSLIYNFFLFFKLAYYSIKEKPDVIYTRQGITLIIPAIISKIFSIPYITEINGAIEEELKLSNSPRFFIRISNFVENFCYSNAKNIISVTEQLKKYISNKYNLSREKVVVLENGVNTNLLKPLNKLKCQMKLKLSKNYHYLCFVGNLTPWQGMDYIIKAMPKILKENKKTKLIIVGEGVERNKLENLAKELNIQKNILFIGSVLQKNVPEYINSSDICVAPFCKNIRNSASGISAFKIYEYASCSKPIISTNLLGIADFLNKNKCGLLVEPSNSKDLADAIIKLLNNPKLAEEMGKNGRKTILNGYSWKNVAEKTQKVIECAVKNFKNKQK